MKTKMEGKIQTERKRQRMKESTRDGDGDERPRKGNNPARRSFHRAGIADELHHSYRLASTFSTCRPTSWYTSIAAPSGVRPASTSFKRSPVGSPRYS